MMTPEMIEVFMKINQSGIEKNVSVKERRNQNHYRQRRLFSFLENEILKFSSLGFEFVKSKPVTLNLRTAKGIEFGFEAFPFEIKLKSKKTEYVFTPKVNGAGNLYYSFVRREYGDEKFVNGSLIWNKEDEDKKSHWYLETSYYSNVLNNGVLDENGLAMLFTSMYCIEL